VSDIYIIADDDKETDLMKMDGSPHAQWGGGISTLIAGYPGAGKTDTAYRPLFCITIDEPGKSGADVSWGKLWLNVSSRVGSPEGVTYSIEKCVRTTWCGYDSGDDEADYTCAQHTEIPWWEVWGDFSGFITKVFSGPSATGWLSIDITDIIKDAIDTGGGVLNIGITDRAQTYGNAWTFRARQEPNPTLRPYVEIEWAEAPPAETFYVSLGGSIAPVGSLSRSIRKGMAGNVSSAGSLSRGISKALGGSVGAAGSLGKQSKKAMAGTLSSIGSLARLPKKTLAGTLGGAGSLTRLTAKATAGAIAPAGSLIKTSTRALAGAVGSAGTLARKAGKSLAGSASPTGTLARAIHLSFAGSLSPIGSLARKTSKTFAGTIIAAGSLSRRFLHVLNVLGGFVRNIPILGSFVKFIDPEGSYEPTIEVEGSATELIDAIGTSQMTIEVEGTYEPTIEVEGSP
jgi:hypothetical protein